MKKGEFILSLLLMVSLLANSCSEKTNDIIEEPKSSVKKENATFSFKINNKLPNDVILEIPLEIEYLHEEHNKQKYNYQLKFEFEEEGKKNATLDGHKPGEWFNINEKIGKLYYKPLSLGRHRVKITSKNDNGTEKSVSFTIVSVTKHSDPVIKNFSFDILEFYGDRFVDKGVIWKQRGHSLSLRISLDVIPYSSKPSLKGRFKIPYFKINHPFECPPHKKQNDVSKCIFEIVSLYIDDALRIDDKQEFEFEIEVENAEGDKSIPIKALKKPELKYKYYD